MLRTNKKKRLKLMIFWGTKSQIWGGGGGGGGVAGPTCNDSKIVILKDFFNRENAYESWGNILLQFVQKQIFSSACKMYTWKKNFEKIQKNRISSNHVYTCRMLKFDFFLNKSCFIWKFRLFKNFLLLEIFFIRPILLAAEELKNFKKFSPHPAQYLFFSADFGQFSYSFKKYLTLGCLSTNELDFFQKKSKLPFGNQML